MDIITESIKKLLEDSLNEFKKDLNDVLSRRVVLTAEDLKDYPQDNEYDNPELQFNLTNVSDKLTAKEFDMVAEGNTPFLLFIPNDKIFNIHLLAKEFVRCVKANCEYFDLPIPENYYISVQDPEDYESSIYSRFKADKEGNLTKFEEGGVVLRLKDIPED